MELIMIQRKKTNPVQVRQITIGNYAPIVIQSMSNSDPYDAEAILAQIEALTKVGCKIVRLTVPDEQAAETFSAVRKQTDTPLVADIHFNYRLAILAIESGADKIRINPGNIGSHDRVKAVVDAARAAHIPIRIGVNSGSLDKKLLEKYGGPTSDALVESALDYIRLMEDLNFNNIILSIKASDVLRTIEACRLLSIKTDVPQHIGITESGTIKSGSIRSAVGIGTLLAEGIGDTIRVSLAGDPVQEISVAKEILKSLDLDKGPVVIACPTCGRTQIDIESLASKVESMVSHLTIPIKIAVMGCVVNGPGEAKDADIGIAGGKHEGLIFVKGQPVEKVPESDLLAAFRKHLDALIK
jgi:(E)-4-hydroxy-3-methylbut-2-enyl-diphosphate synthase